MVQDRPWPPGASTDSASSTVWQGLPAFFHQQPVPCPSTGWTGGLVPRDTGTGARGVWGAAEARA